MDSDTILAVLQQLALSVAELEEKSNSPNANQFQKADEIMRRDHQDALSELYASRERLRVAEQLLATELSTAGVQR